jgi:hypothetical protein
MQPVPIATRWASSVSPTNAWTEYPRPQMVRDHWQNLNGLWDYAITARDVAPPRQYDGHILVPYPVESALSGVKRSLRADQWLWYRRKVDVGIGPMNGRVLLHFGAVDYEATVYLNGQELGAHSGGYQSFSFDITKLLRTGENELVVRVYDPTEQGPNPQGKQKVDAQWMFYGASSGIWQTVWLEHVTSTYISALKLTPDVDRSEVRIEVSVDGEKDAFFIEAIARDGDQVVARGKIQGSTALRVNQPRLWSPDDPHLYDLELRLIQADRVVDSVKSYFGLRKIEIKADSEGRARIHLNDRYTYNLAAVDQGYWPDGLYTAPSDVALEFDVKTIKALGFNTARKHIKIEPQRWYYHCDRLGLLVWQDMPSSKNDSPEARLQFEREIEENLRQLHNHPSITTWVLFNEGWGAYDQERLALWMKQADPSRLLNGHSGPYDQIGESRQGRDRELAVLLRPLGGPGPVMSDLHSTQFQASESWMVGDMVDLHFYPGPKMFPAQAERASVTGEHGSFGVYIEGHVWDELGKVGRGMGGTAMSPQQMLAAYASSIQTLRTLEKEGLSGSGYFQIFDVEGEHQGFLTYDRAVAKVSVAEVARLNAEIVPRAKNYEKAIEGFFVEDADRTPDSQRYERLFQEFRSGQRDLMFLRRLSSLALRLGNTAQATELANEFISLASWPYTKEIWRSILAITGSSQCKGFELLRACADEINASLEEQAAQKKILDIIGRELIVPYFQDKHRKTTWTEFENSVALAHGQLGREAAVGARMMEDFCKEDWTSFAASYVRYFETATPRSPYSLHSLSYRVLKHVTDLQTIEAAIRVMGWQINAVREWPVCGRYDAVELDTYANLLHKVGRTLEAIEWQQKAVDVSGGRDGEITANLERMKRAMSISRR